MEQKEAPKGLQAIAYDYTALRKPIKVKCTPDRSSACTDRNTFEAMKLCTIDCGMISSVGEVREQEECLLPGSLRVFFHPLVLAGLGPT